MINLINVFKMRVVCFFLFIALGHFSIAQTEQVYKWSSVKIGGGGYITGMKIQPENAQLQYLRTDVGGAYRWDQNENEMVQLLNFPETRSSYYGVAGIALHPVKQNVIYLAVDRGNSTQTSNILYSEDYGKNWEVINVPETVKFGANGGRENSKSDDTDREGSPITVNPQNPNELWVGSREGGLWILNRNQPEIWTKVSDIPDNSEEQSIRSVIFHPRFQNVIFVGYFGEGIYRSNDGGTSFSKINADIADLNEVADMSLSKNGDKLYVAVRNKGVYRLNNPTTNTEEWQNLNIPFAEIYRGYQTVTASLHDNDVVIASVAAPAGNNLARLQVSMDSGENWITKSNTQISNSFPWKNTDRSAGAHTSQLIFDPSDPKKLFLTCWFGLWHTDNWQEDLVKWSNDRTRGVEEIVPSGLYSFPENTAGNLLGINSADYPAIISKNTNSYENTDVRELMNDDSGVGKGICVVACEAYPNNYIISSTRFWKPQNGLQNDGYLLFTSDGGKNYRKLTGYKKEWGRSLVAISARDPSNIVVAHGNQIHFSTDKGENFQEASINGLGITVVNNVFRKHRPLAHDFVTNHTFYIYDQNSGKVYRSVNKGRDWSFMGNMPSGVESNEFTSSSLKATPERSGHLWFNHPGKGLYRSTDGGATWNKISSVLKAQSIALGKAEQTNGYPTIYMIGTTQFDNTKALYRSIDEGESWVKINDAETSFLLNAKYIEADRTVFGKVYVGIGGLGVYQGVIDDNTLTNGYFANQRFNKELRNIIVHFHTEKKEVYVENLSSEHIYEIEFYSLNGQLVKRTKINHLQKNIPVYELDRGIFILKIKCFGVGEEFVSKVVVR